MTVTYYETNPPGPAEECPKCGKMEFREIAQEYGAGGDYEKYSCAACNYYKYYQLPD